MTEFTSEELYGVDLLTKAPPLKINLPEEYQRRGGGDELHVWYVTINEKKLTIVEESGACMNMGPELILSPEGHILPSDLVEHWIKEDET